MSIEILAANGAIELANRTVQTIRSGGTKNLELSATLPLGSASGSLTDVVANAIVEPMVLVDASVAQHESAGEIMQSCLSIFAGYYMQAIHLQGHVNNVVVGQKLGRFNPNRNNVAFESFHQDGSPTLRRLNGVNSLAFEDAFSQVVGDLAAAKINVKDKKADEAVPSSTMSVGGKSFETLRDNVNLSVGRIFNVEMKEGEKTFTIPVAIRLIVKNMTDDQMAKFFTFRTAFDLDMKERWHGYRAGRLSFWRDLVLCNDLIAKYRKAALSDKSGVTAEQLRRESNNIASSISNPDKVSLATVSNIVVMSTATLASVEAELGGSIDGMAVRKAIFDNTNLMILVVVDSYHDIVKFYHRGVTMASTLTIRDIKASNKNGGPDVADIMRTYLLGNAPMGR